MKKVKFRVPVVTVIAILIVNFLVKKHAYKHEIHFYFASLINVLTIIVDNMSEGIILFQFHADYQN